MKRLLLDLNVLLDVILDRAGAPVASEVWAALESRRGEGYVPAHGLTTVFYVVARARGRAFARLAVDGLMRAFAVAPVNEDVLRHALLLDWPDFEDAVCAAAAAACGCDGIVTRDPCGYRESPVEVIDPATARAWLAEE
ncbi:MAG: PIN domain-containing protein [Deltaproteobacteria bacterium]|nr:PIN domain-containing protein [Deltaproteobacteria bacterium]